MANQTGTNNLKVEDKGKAYMGDGMHGIGTFLQGVAAAYLFTKTFSDTSECSSQNTNNQRNAEGTKDTHDHGTDDLRRDAVKDDYTTDDLKHDVLSDVDEDITIGTATEEELERVQKHLTDEQEGILLSWLRHARDKYLNPYFTKQHARQDIKEGLDSIFDEYKKDFLPKIYSQQCAHGIYNDTTSQLLANDAYASTVVKGGKLYVDTIVEYQKIIKGFSDEVGNALKTAIASMLRENIDTQRYEDQEKVTHQDKRINESNFNTRANVTSTMEESNRNTDRSVFELGIDTETTVNDTQACKVSHTKTTVDQQPNLKEFLKDAAIMALFSAILKPFIDRPYCEQHKEDCAPAAEGGGGGGAVVAVVAVELTILMVSFKIKYNINNW